MSSAEDGERQEVDGAGGRDADSNVGADLKIMAKSVSVSPDVGVKSSQIVYKSCTKQLSTLSRFRR